MAHVFMVSGKNGSKDILNGRLLKVHYSPVGELLFSDVLSSKSLVHTTRISKVEVFDGITVDTTPCKILYIKTMTGSEYELLSVSDLIKGTNEAYRVSAILNQLIKNRNEEQKKLAGIIAEEHRTIWEQIASEIKRNL